MRSMREILSNCTPWFRGGGKRSFYPVVAGVISIFTCFVFSASSVFAAGTGTQPCKHSNGATYYSDQSTSSPNLGYWYAQVQTGSESGTPPYEIVSYDYSRLGAKANITTGGNPAVNNTATQHVLAQLSAVEQSMYNRWVQVGWILGVFGKCGGVTQPTSTPQVFVEIYDDTGSSSCFTQLYGSAPSNASYDGRYYGVVNGKYEYRVYYQALGSPTIQYLAFGDFSNQKLAEVAGGEVSVSGDGTTTNAPICPTLGTSGNWNLIGYTGSTTFASTLQLWNGSSWYDWTPTSASPSSSFADPPYLFQSSAQFTLNQVGGQ